LAPMLLFNHNAVLAVGAWNPLGRKRVRKSKRSMRVLVENAPGIIQASMRASADVVRPANFLKHTPR
jgi:hypothetical protein